MAGSGGKVVDRVGRRFLNVQLREFLVESKSDAPKFADWYNPLEPFGSLYH